MLHNQVFRLVAVVGIAIATTAPPAFGQEDPGTTIEDPSTTLQEPPSTDPPATDPPATEPPATEPPATDPPATRPPATDPPQQNATIAPQVAPEVAPQAPGDPPGNNGTVKVDGVEFDDHPDNEPHVGCVFQIDFYGFDQGADQIANVLFTAVPPTPGGSTGGSVFVGEDPAGGGTDLDASRTFDLSALLAGIEPHPIQGHHVSLDVTLPAPGGAKQKTFWVEGCGPPPTTTTTSTTTTSTSTTSTTMPTTTTTCECPTTTTTTTKPPETTTTTKPPETTTTAPPETTTTAPPRAEVTTTSAAPLSVPTTTPLKPEGELPKTGTDTLPIVGLGAGLLALGAAIALASRRASAS